MVRPLSERRAQGVGGRNWKAWEGGRCPLSAQLVPPFTLTTTFSLLLASPMRGKGDDADVCDQLDVGDFDIGLEIFSKISVETR